MKVETVGQQKTWEEFRETGLLWWINMILHTFGWVIVFEYENQSGELVRVFPARTKFRGFSEKHNVEGYIKVSEYLKDNISELAEEAKE